MARLILAFLMAVMPVVSSADAKSHYTDLRTYCKSNSVLTLSLENGSTGILSIKYVLVVPDRSGRSTYVLYADSYQFWNFANAVAESDGPAYADFEGTQLSVSLFVSARGDRMYGRMTGTGEHVIVKPMSRL